MKALLVAALLVSSVACGAYQFPGGTPSPSPSIGTVSGRVIAVPCAPIEQAGSTCAGRPVPNLELEYIGGGAVISKAITDSGGNYSVVLEPGQYVVKMRTYMRVISGPLSLTVSAGSSLVANYVLDSGIRVPVPQPAPA